MTQGSFAYPESIDSAPVRAFASAVASVAATFDEVDDRVDAAASTARLSWTGIAADTFGNHMSDRGHVFELASAQLRRAVAELHELADGIDTSKRSYRRAVAAEASARARNLPADVDAAVWSEREAYSQALIYSIGCSKKLGEIAGILDEYTRRSFIPVGQRMDQFGASTLTGRDLLADSLLATQETRTDPDEIQIRRLDDGSYVVILGGVTDLSSNALAPWRLFQTTPPDRSRLVDNSWGSVLGNGPNQYADAVKVAMQRAGVPAGSDVTFVGHSYGTYTAIDLANDDAFNSVDGDSNGYNVRVRNVAGFAADVDWKFDDLPAGTNTVVMNNRDDLVFRAETRFHPEVGDYFRAAPVPVPWSRPSESLPSGRTNQVEVEINAGRQWNSSDGFISGHHQQNYVDAIPNVDDRSARFYDDVFRGRTVVEGYNVRVPKAPVDTIPESLQRHP